MNRLITEAMVRQVNTLPHTTAYPFDLISPALSRVSLCLSVTLSL